MLLGSTTMKLMELNTMVNLDNAKLIGEGEWVKDSAYRVYELDRKFYSVIIISQMNMELLEDTIEEIKEEEIKNYI
jgi:hypothetical protein